MKKILHLITIICFSFSKGQNIIINDVNGNKIIAQDKSFDYKSSKTKISYKLVGEKWNKKLKYEDIKDIYVGNDIYMRSVKLIKENGKEKDANLFFVLIENEKYTLLLHSYTYVGKYASINIYDLYITDKNNKIIEELHFKESKTAYEKTRASIKPKLKKYFSDCKSFIEFLNSIPDDTKNYLNILSQFLDSPTKHECN